METVKSIGATLIGVGAVILGLSMWFGHFWALYGDWIAWARPGILRALGIN